MTSLTVLINNEKKATEPTKYHSTDKDPQEAAEAGRTRKASKENIDAEPCKRQTTLSRAGADAEKPPHGALENSPLTPNFVLANSNKTKQEKSDFAVTVEQVNAQRPLK